MEKPKIRIDLTDEDLHDLINGETFDWTYTTDTGISIDVHLFNADLTCAFEGCDNESAEDSEFCDEHQDQEEA